MAIMEGLRQAIKKEFNIRVSINSQQAGKFLKESHNTLISTWDIVQDLKLCSFMCSYVEIKKVTKVYVKTAYVLHYVLGRVWIDIGINCLVLILLNIIFFYHIPLKNLFCTVYPCTVYPLYMSRVYLYMVKKSENKFVGIYKIH